MAEYLEQLAQLLRTQDQKRKQANLNFNQKATEEKFAKFDSEAFITALLDEAARNFKTAVFVRDNPYNQSTRSDGNPILWDGNVCTYNQDEFGYDTNLKTTDEIFKEILICTNKTNDIIMRLDTRKELIGKYDQVLNYCFM